MMRRLPAQAGAAALALTTALLFGSVARAQEPYPGPPSYAVRQESIRGTVRSFDGQWLMYVRDGRGNLDRVRLHQGTIITPTGLTLEPGMHVTVYGHPGDGVFVADDIETPYRYVRYQSGYGYPYSYPSWEGNFGWGFGGFGGWGGDDDDEGCCGL